MVTFVVMVFFIVLIVIVGIIIQGIEPTYLQGALYLSKYKFRFCNLLSHPLSQCLIYFSCIQTLPISFPLKAPLVPGLLAHLSFPSHAVDFHPPHVSVHEVPSAFPAFSPSPRVSPRMVRLDRCCFRHPHTVGRVGDPIPFTCIVAHGMFIVDLLFHPAPLGTPGGLGRVKLGISSGWVFSTSLMIVVMDNYYGLTTLPTSWGTAWPL